MAWEESLHHIVLAASGNAEMPQLVIVLAQLALIMGVSLVFGEIFRWIGQPTVVGQIAAGLALGPSVLGRLETLGGWGGHPLSGWVFAAGPVGVLGVLSQVGLILLMFLIGLEVQVQHLKSVVRPALWVVVLGVGLPLILGVVGGYELWPVIERNSDGWAAGGAAGAQGFAWFLGVAMAITALPVLGRILVELGILRTRVGSVAMAAAGVGDVVGWILLAAVSAWVGARYRVMETVWMVALTAAFAAVVLVGVRPAVRWVWRRYVGAHGHAGLALLLVVLFAAAGATHLIGISSIFGAVLLGVALSDDEALRHQTRARLEGFVQTFFIPIFFTYAGLRTDVGTLGSGVLWAVGGVVLTLAVVGKFGGCTAGAWTGGLGWRESACVGVLMNTRGLMELVVANLGYDLGVIPRSVYCMLVLMALVTTLMTTPLVMWLKRGTELDEPVRTWALARRRGWAMARRKQAAWGSGQAEVLARRTTFTEITEHE